MATFDRISGPAAEPLTLAEAKAHLRVDLSDDDAMIQRMIVAAREWVETVTGRALMTQSWRMTLDAWPDGEALALIRPPVQAVTAVRTFDAASAANVWAEANYALRFGAEPQGLVRLASAWPAPGRGRMGIEIDLTCGYGAVAADVPASLRQAVLSKTARLYERRGDDAGEAPDEATRLVAPYRTVRL
jgi:uncharacterized phiE125 gp8 family phage protein